MRTIPSTHAYVDIERHGDLSGLTWYQSPLRYHHTSEASVSEICDVHYASLNFRDVMLASGKLPLDAIPGFHLDQGCMLGMEFSGTDTKGNRVMGLVPKKVCFEFEEILLYHFMRSGVVASILKRQLPVCKIVHLIKW